jgi:hypothetical protein
MGLAVQNAFTTNFPTITFRRKRVTVAIHAYFDLEDAEDAATVKQTIEDVMSRLTKHGQAKHSYSIVEI